MFFAQVPWTLNIKSPPVLSSSPAVEENRPQKSAGRPRRSAMTGNGQAWLMAGKEKQDRRGHPRRHYALARISKRLHEIWLSNLIETMRFCLGGIPYS